MPFPEHISTLLTIPAISPPVQQNGEMMMMMIKWERNPLAKKGVQVSVHRIPAARAAASAQREARGAQFKTNNQITQEGGEIETL